MSTAMQAARLTHGEAPVKSPMHEPILMIKIRNSSKMKSVYVGNLSFGVTEQTVRSLFEVYGTVERVHIVTDRETGQPKGFAFVEMPSDAEAEKAISAVNGH